MKAILISIAAICVLIIIAGAAMILSLTDDTEEE